MDDKDRPASQRKLDEVLSETCRGMGIAQVFSVGRITCILEEPSTLIIRKDGREGWVFDLPSAIRGATVAHVDERAVKVRFPDGRMFVADLETGKGRLGFQN